MPFRRPIRALLPRLLARCRTEDLAPEQLRERYALPSSTFLPLGEHRVHVIDEGQGPALLLLHGTASSARTWDGWAELLRAHYRVIRPDLPGFGLTGTLPGHGHTMPAHVSTIRALLDALAVPEVCVVGNSLGGQIGAYLAGVEPRRVRALGLIGPAGFNRPAPGPFAFTRVPLLRRVFGEITPRVGMAAGLAWAYGNPLSVRRSTVHTYYDLLLYPGNRRAMLDAIGLAPVHADTEAALRRVHCPVLIQWGGRDRLARPSEAARFLACLSDAHLVTYPDLGHVLQEEAPARTCADLEAFLVRCAALQPGCAPTLPNGGLARHPARPGAA